MCFRSLLLLLLVGCGPALTEDQEAMRDAILALEADDALGEALYAEHCATCHGPDRTGGDGGPAIDHTHGLASVVGYILAGPRTMPSFEETLTLQEIADVASFVENAAQD